ncbi:MAG: ABC transporter ATP-binding protein [Cellulosilyticaceae bacterium]
MIKVDHLSKTFTKTIKEGHKRKKQSFFAVNNISFEVKEGEIYGILGPNGAGKTTLLRMLGGILTPTQGRVEIGGFDSQLQGNEMKGMLGYLSGNTKLYGRLSPRELFEVFGQLYGMTKEETKVATKQVEQIMDMGGFIDNRIEHLSTGQTQRTSIGRCLIHSPSVYIFDEPTLGLDVLSSHAIIEFMKEEKKRGKTVLYSTHYMEEAETLCDKILMIHKGEIIAQGTPTELKAQTNQQNLRDVFIKLVADREGHL